jgi:hypothetical protein
MQGIIGTQAPPDYTRRDCNMPWPPNACAWAGDAASGVSCYGYQAGWALTSTGPAPGIYWTRTGGNTHRVEIVR